MAIVHPRRLEARDAYIDAYLNLDLSPALTKLVANGARLRVIMLIMGLHGVARDDDPATWPTQAVLIDEVAARRLGSPNFVQSLLARLVDRGFVELAAVPTDRRVRRLVPTDLLMERMLDLVAARSAAASVVAPVDFFAPARARDRPFALSYFAASQLPRDEIKRQRELHPEIMDVLFRDNGIMILIALLGDARASPDHATARIGHAGIASLLKISRTHVRDVLGTLAEAGLVEVGQTVRVSPRLWELFDEYVVETSQRFAHFCAGFGAQNG